jgi:membrane protein YqaA with SNARE-associated domain
LFWASFAETIIVPIPIEVVLVPFMLARRHQIWRIATITTAGCLAAAVLGYGLGHFFFESAGRWLLDTLGYGAAFQSFQSTFNAHGFWAIVAIGIIPIPFQVAMLAAGIAGYPFLMFLLAATIARGIRYYGLACLVLTFGGRALDLWRSHSRTVGVAALALVMALLLALNFLPKLFI